MKSYTDIEQSKKLAEILPLESADIFYDQYGVIRIGNPKERYSDYHQLPVWSLAALLKMLKDYQLFSNGLIVYIDNESYKIDSDNPVDACVAMIEKLHEQNLL